VSVVYGTTANVADAAIRNFRIGPSLSDRIRLSDSNLEALQVPTTASTDDDCSDWLVQVTELIDSYWQWQSFLSFDDFASAEKR